MHIKSFLLTAASLGTMLACGAIKFENNFDWSKAQQLCPGIVYSKFELQKPRIMKFAAVRVDLHTPGLNFLTPKRPADWGKPMPDYPKRPIRTERMTCRKFMENAVADGKNMVLTVNASPWGPWEPPWTHKYGDNLGLVISEGELVSFANKRATLVQYKDGTVDIANFDKNSDISKIRNAISGFHVTLVKGKIKGGDNPKVLAPRTGFGLSADRRYLYIFVVDGRQPGYSMGTTIYEVGETLKYLGAYDGMNMDGGGSTTLVIRENGKIRKLNHYRNNSERAVAGSLGIYITPEKEKK